MNNKELTTTSVGGALAEYNAKLDLVAVRLDPVAFPRISATPKDRAVMKMARIVYASFLYRNQATTEAVVMFTAEALVDEILADFHFGLSTLSWAEIGMVIRRAVLGGGKELYGVSVASLYAALVDYAKTEGHDASAKAHFRRNPHQGQDDF